MKNIRSKKLLEFIRKKKNCSIDELLGEFDVSMATIHRDLSELAAANLIRKVHGGVEILNLPIWPKGENSDFDVRIQKNNGLKQEIAKKAVSCVNDGGVIFIDSSSTALCFARRLREKLFSSLTIVTNSLAVVQEFPLFPQSFTLMSIGGIYNPRLNSFLGRVANSAVAGLKIDMAFVSAAGVSLGGVYTFNENHAEFLEFIIRNSDFTNLLADSTKFDREAVFRICGVKNVGKIITDSRLSEDVREKYLRAGLDVA